MEERSFDYQIRQASTQDTQRIWQIVQQAIAKRGKEGSDQWQDGYPNRGTIANDIDKGYGYVLEVEGSVAAYVAIIFDGEPVYKDIKGTWLSDGDYTVIHRVAVAQDLEYKGVGTLLMKLVEDVSKQHGSYSIKADTKHDNASMLRVFEKLGYQYCGEVIFRGNAQRKAFEKQL